MKFKPDLLFLFLSPKSLTVQSIAVSSPPLRSCRRSGLVNPPPLLRSFPSIDDNDNLLPLVLNHGQTLMDYELQILTKDLEDKTVAKFSEFMLRIANFEELVKVARRFLVSFSQEFESFRKPQLHITSKLVDHVIDVNQTQRMKTYIEAGSRHRHDDIQYIYRLHMSTRGLQDHLSKVKVLLDELEHLKEEAIDMAKRVNDSVTQFLEGGCDEGFSLKEEDMVESMNCQDKTSSYAVLMAVMYSMLKLDCEMQENIINSVKSAAVSSEQIENYCLMWNRRPYIDDNVMRRAWKLISQ